MRILDLVRQPRDKVPTVSELKTAATAEETEAAQFKKETEEIEAAIRALEKKKEELLNSKGALLWKTERDRTSQEHSDLTNEVQLLEEGK